MGAHRLLCWVTDAVTPLVSASGSVVGEDPNVMHDFSMYAAWSRMIDNL
jgi:hypothetical protein